MILGRGGFELVGKLQRNEHGCQVPSHPTCGWHLWAYTVAFRWSETGRWLLTEEHIVRDDVLCNLSWKWLGFAYELKLGAGF